MTSKVIRRNGPAGSLSVTAETADGALTFVGSVYGGPVVMVTPSGMQTFVSDPGRFGDFSRDSEGWTRRFIGEAERGEEPCRGCGDLFPYDADADFCPRCAAENAGV